MKDCVSKVEQKCESSKISEKCTRFELKKKYKAVNFFEKAKNKKFLNNSNFSAKSLLAFFFQKIRDKTRTSDAPSRYEEDNVS